ncbi:TonB-dependent receptor plug domain-containing protein [Chryseolinea lacunae]|uniref:TonB-dependent receptor plug domain-containing protein n=1 Tax=Chryseolinea lacunae TaxID=2801331 RepID=A0ABS1KUQ3_9BACT|nr:TonB-dependent receptor plug domain-containing protein [Chryseolinea lacunae]MBL0743104.1 TonB-dependent receptor plug domain-containing protein [Chryseolinea lacunae]
MKRIVYIALLLFAFVLQASFDNIPFLEKLKASLQHYNRQYPEEKVYLQFDKTFYKPGEDIWFNAFVLNSNHHTATTISDVVYVELIDPKGNLATRLELFVKEGTSRGDFKLTEAAAGGLYKIKAYTQWMKNGGDDNAFKKEIIVQRVITPRLLLKLDFEKEAYGVGDRVTADLSVRDLRNEPARSHVKWSVSLAGSNILSSTAETDNTGATKITFTLPQDLKTSDGLLQVLVENNGVQESISRSVPIVLNKIALQFFPEGGDLVEDVPTQVAFKAVNEFGKGADVSGQVLDDDGKFVCTFESYHMGMGAFSFVAKPGKQYRAIITKPVGIAGATLLPKPQAQGFGLTKAAQDDDDATFEIHAPFATDGFLVGQVQGELYHTGKVTLKAGKNTVAVNTKKFPPGIAVFTLFDAQGLEQCERLVFVNAKTQLNIKIKSDKKHYQPREQVSLDIETTDANGHPIPAKLSLAVVDDQLISMADDKQDNILSWCLLSSELKGAVQEPSFYFDKTEPKATLALDYLLMTQGWRRFNWSTLATPKEITYAPEKENLLLGSVSDGKKLSANEEVILMELNNRRRIANVKTTGDGKFMFKNIDPTTPILLLSRRPNKMVLHKGNTSMDTIFPSGVGDDAAPSSDVRSETLQDNVGPAVEKNPGLNSSTGFDMSMDPDIQQLSEVVVVGYAATERRDMTGSVSVVRWNALEGFAPALSFETALQGRVAGVQIQSQPGNPGSHTGIVIRGASSLASGNREPLFVIDGVPVGNSLNTNFSTGSIINPNNIESITVLQSPEASALYGSQAINGVIVINTRSRIWRGNLSTKRKASRYDHLTIFPRAFSAVREFYAPVYSRKEQGAPRNDFRTTVYWNPTVVTDNRGKASLSFFNGDITSTFRITAEGMSGLGLLGRTEETYFTELPFSIDAKLPEFIGYEDTLKIPVRIKNTTSKILSGELVITVPDALTASAKTVNVNVAAHQTQTTYITLVPQAKAGVYPVTIQLSSGDYRDEIHKSLQVHPVGFPVQLDFGGKALDTLFRFAVHDVEKGSLQARLTAYPDVISDLFTGAESILRAPHGCFEQVSSSTFPNILALQYLRKAGISNPAAEDIALRYIKSGYQQLAAYEIKDGGFEWFGHPPAHEALSAYGLVEFHEMKKVYPGVDEAMLTRTRDWLMSRRDNAGGFRQNHGKYGFSSAPKNTNNAYIVYALALTGSKDIRREYETARDEAWSNKDLYRMALLANAAFELNAMDDYQKFVTHFRHHVTSTQLKSVTAENSITWSQGVSLENETIGFWVQALLKEGLLHKAVVDRCIHFLLEHRQYGSFGSTQAITVSLQALTAYANVMRAIQESGDVALTVNGQRSQSRHFEKDTKDKLVLDRFAHQLTSDGSQTVRVAFEGTKLPLPYSLQLQWSSKTPPSHERCPVKIETVLNQSSVRANETVRLRIQLANKTASGLPMTLAVVGIPAGLAVQPWQLKELQEKGVFDFYEILEDRIAFYYREMGPSETRTINLDLKAEIPGRYTGAANAAYLYYSHEWKHWTKGLTVNVAQ